MAVYLRDVAMVWEELRLYPGTFQSRGDEKEGAVLRVLRGESLDLVARETGQPAGRIACWREEFLAAGREGLKSRPVAVEDVALRDAQRKVGELSMEVDVLNALLERKGALRRRGARGPGARPRPGDRSAYGTDSATSSNAE